MLSFTREVLALRRSSPALSVGRYDPISDTPRDCLAFLRCADDECLLVALNFGRDECRLALPGLGPPQPILGTHGSDVLFTAEGGIRLRPAEAVVLRTAR